MRRSPALALALALGHGAAMAVTWTWVESPWIAGACCVALAAMGGRAIRRDALMAAPDSVIAVRIDGTGLWTLSRRDGRRIDTTRSGHGWITAWGVVVPLHRAPDGPIGLCMAADAVDEGALRCLRVRLRWGHEALLEEAVSRRARDPTL